mmetsp:Transcript_69519/g.182210  ORF Transcript_69519/g.182210 Transcript_69519/m.182210 type:complete len:321 (+) Transcript_69519:171-1133(+)
MRLTLKNTFLTIDFGPQHEGEGGPKTEAGAFYNSDAPPSPRCVELSRSCLEGNTFSSPLRRTRSAECLSPAACLFDREEVVQEIQMGRLNTLLGSPLRPSSSRDDMNPFCIDDTAEAPLSEASAQATVSDASTYTSGLTHEDAANSAKTSLALRSCDSVSTMAPSVSGKEYCHKNVPRHVDLEEQYRTVAQGIPPTTLMIRNIPNRYSQSELVEELESAGLGGGFDFVYLPLDRSSRASVGYAFVNFISYSWAELCREALAGHRFLLHSKGKTAVVSTAHLQGLDANLAHYEKLAVTKSKVADHRPLVIAGSSEVLPPPR